MDATFVDEDWRRNKKYILESLNDLSKKLDNLQSCMQSSFAELRTEVEVMKVSAPTVSSDEIEDMVSRILKKKNTSQHQQLSRDEIRRIAEESVKAKNGHNKPTPMWSRDWPPWLYVLLGAVVAVVGNRLPEFLLAITERFL